jgi:UDP-N-acetylglucosamine--N-acetylmuramyl-(pentapeptide) pyrophosphoryl-undecaprenol N-acetylglucosamine transferase
MGHFDGKVESHILEAMGADPYYEVRAQACRTAAHFARCLAGKEPWLEALLNRLGDKSFEVAAEAALAIGEIGMDGRALSALLGLKADFYWQVRDAGLKGIKRLIERRVVPPSRDLISQLSAYILTATDFKPYFSIKETYRNIYQLCLDRMGAEDGSAVREARSMAAEAAVMEK